MKTEQFKVLNFIRKLILDVDEELKNFPKKDIEIKNRIRTNSYDILEIAYEANLSKNKDKKLDLIEKVLCKVKIIDFLLNLSQDKELITIKKYRKIAKQLEDILIYSGGWYKSTEKSK